MCPCCRCARGLESPELARALLEGEGTYQPDFPIDIWAFGQLILNMVGATLPPAHTAQLHSPAYLEGLKRSSDHPKDVPGLAAHLRYIASLIETDEYADQVCS